MKLCRRIKCNDKAKKKNKFVSGKWPENLNAKCIFFFFFFFLRGAKVNFQVNIHIIIQMVDEFVPSYVPFPMQLLLQSIYLLNILLFCRSQLLNLAHTRHVTGVKLIMECLWTAERFAIFKLFLIYFSEIFWRHSFMILMLITYFKRKLFQLVILLQILILFASSFTPKAIFHSGE